LKIENLQIDGKYGSEETVLLIIVKKEASENLTHSLRII